MTHKHGLMVRINIKPMTCLERLLFLDLDLDLDLPRLFGGGDLETLRLLGGGDLEMVRTPLGGKGGGGGRGGDLEAARLLGGGDLEPLSLSAGGVIERAVYLETKAGFLPFF